VTLRDALATAIYAGVPGANPKVSQARADAILSDPAFRAALTESIAEALVGVDWSEHTRTTEVTTEADLPIRVFESEVDMDSFAAAIVARMLGG
jgi:hypothetical protein